MIFYFENDISHQYNDILDELNSYSNSQNSKLDIVLNCLMKICSSVLSSDAEKSEPTVNFLKAVKKLTSKFKNNITSIQELLSTLDGIKFEDIGSPAELSDDLKDKIQNYNDLASKLKNDLCMVDEEFNSFINEYIKNYPIQDNPITSESKGAVDTKLENNLNEANEENGENGENGANGESGTAEAIKDNRTLLISEKHKKVFLPYYVSDLNEILEQNSNYSDIQQIIDSEFVVPISRFSSSIISRFKEGYNLMRKKENAPITDSLDIALELAFNSLLNPAIVAACRNLDELDIYLDCLSSNELDKFDIFEVEYEFLPAKI